MRPNCSLVCDTQCVHYAECRVSMHGTWMEMHDNGLKISCTVHVDPSLNLVCFSYICHFVIFFSKCHWCSIDFTAPIGTDGNVIENSSIGCWLMLQRKSDISPATLFLHMVYSGYLLHGIKQWILE
ncbi:hypothetical protein NE237_001535 [Protea cynaroides]|uniref:Uncharacterized protein n=1 Tax=Protea cynaroides TaxID=273540 RepID=A0A9Q0KTP6_9MAGN|nr:hypothetical protein NE237_001535 [Protea cynaroides]